jgi:hypothetical protein
MAQSMKPHWQPISALPLLATAIEGMLEAAERQQQNLQVARHCCSVLDDTTVRRVIDVFTRQLYGPASDPALRSAG